MTESKLVVERKDDLKVTLPSDREVLITRSFNAPRRLVWEASAKPEHVRQWWGLRSMTMTVCEIDHRVGGKWRFVLRAPDGSEHAWSGTYSEIHAPERVVNTEVYENIPGAESLVTTTFEERDGRTYMTTRMLHKSKENRDGYINAGAEGGMRETFERLDELLDKMVP